MSCFDLWPVLGEKAGRLCCSIIKSKPFINRNEMTGLHAMILHMNGASFSTYVNDNLADAILKVASGKISWKIIVYFIFLPFISYDASMPVL